MCEVQVTKETSDIWIPKEQRLLHYITITDTRRYERAVLLLLPMSVLKERTPVSNEHQTTAELVEVEAERFFIYRCSMAEGTVTDSIGGV